MKIKICGIFREQDIDYVNEARPDYIGFVFAQSKRMISSVLAQHFRFRLADSIVPVGVFVNAPLKEIAEFYRNGIISAAQLHGNEDESYIKKLRELTDTGSSGPIRIIKAIFLKGVYGVTHYYPKNADYILFDSGAGSGKPFNWKEINSIEISKPWFLAGGIGLENIEKAAALNPFAVDISSGAETKGVKDRRKILDLVGAVRKTKGAKRPEGISIEYTMESEHHRKKLSLNIK